MSMQTPSDADQALEAALRGQLYRFDCPTAQTLGEYQLDLLASGLRVAVAGHLTTCTECQAELALVRRYLTIPLEPSPTPAGRARRWLAALVSAPPEVAFGGLRGEAGLATRIFGVEDITLTMELAEDGLVRGLVVTAADSTELAGRHVRWRTEVDGELQAAATLDDLGTFELAGLAAGTYTVEIDLPDGELVVEHVDVSH
jgi:hypothetical protein